jgi:hypothetical protein
VREPEQYEARFDELMKVGFPWMNVTCLGVIDGMLLVGVELPRVAPPEPAKRTSINLSGPMAKVLNSGWSAEEVLSIE